MPDKSYVQAIQDLQDRLSSQSLDTIVHMLTHRTTVSQATLNIQDENVRTVVKNALITDQISCLAYPHERDGYARRNTLRRVQSLSDAFPQVSIT